LTKKKDEKKVVKSKTTKKQGRPSKYTKEIGEKICLQLLEGKSLRKICDAPEMPSKRTVCKWLVTDMHEGFRHQYAHARAFQAQLEFDEIKEITDAEPRYIIDDKGVKRVDTGFIQLQRLRADKRQWRASKLAPKVFGGDAIIIADEASKKGQQLPPIVIGLTDDKSD
jgi:hypothetical protein